MTALVAVKEEFRRQLQLPVQAIAMGAGADVAMRAVGITLMRDDPIPIADAVAISRATYRTIRENPSWKFFYHVVGLPFAGLGLLSPMIAAVVMAFLSVSVLTNASRLRKWRPARAPVGANA